MMRYATVDKQMTFNKKILFLTNDSDTLTSQLNGNQIVSSDDLMDNISTDEITPGWTCFWYDKTLGDYSLVGLRNNTVKPKSIKNGGFDVIVSGKSKGCGSSRETAPYSEKYAGIKLVVAKSFEKIY